MPRFTFICRDCLNVFDREVPAPSAPGETHPIFDYQPVCECGSHNCKRHTRLGRHEFNESALKFQSMYPYVSTRLSLNHPGCERHTDQGKSIVENRDHERRLCAEYGMVRE